jgi:hypothetical protein
MAWCSVKKITGPDLPFTHACYIPPILSLISSP